MEVFKSTNDKGTADNANKKLHTASVLHITKFEGAVMFS